MEVLSRSGAGRVLVPSVVTVEALTGGAHDAQVNRILKQVDLDEVLPLVRTRAAATLRQGSDASAVDAVVAQAAHRTQAAYLITSDPTDLASLMDAAIAATAVIAV